MYIHEAVKLSMETGSPIANNAEMWGASVLHLWPTDSAAGVLMFIQIGSRGEKVNVRWNPSASDLMSNEWFIVSKEELFSAEKAELVRRAEQAHARRRGRWWSRCKAALRHRRNRR